MADFQGINPNNIAQGWAPEPQLHAPEIGSLVNAILESRYRNQKLTQDTISEAIKAQQARNQAGMFGTALQNEGLVSPGTDLSGMSSTDLARLVQARLEQTPDTEMDAYHKAAAAKEQAMADWIRSGKPLSAADTGDVDTSQLQPRQNPVTGIWEYPSVSARGVVNWHPYASANQPTSSRPQNQDQVLKEQNALLQSKSVMDADMAVERQKNIDAGKANVPYSRSDEYNRTVNRLRQIQQGGIAPSTNVPSTTPTPAPSGGGYNAPPAPPVGTVDGGYRFKGGDPQNPDSWEPVQ